MEELSVEQRRATTSAPLIVFPRLESCSPAINKLDVGTYLLLHVRATITTPGVTNAVARITLSWPETLFCETITVPPKRRGCDCLGTHFRRH